MKFFFDYEETRIKCFEVEADNLADAINDVYKQLDKELEWDRKDLYMGELTMPLDKNFLPHVKIAGVEQKKSEVEDMNIVIDSW